MDLKSLESLYNETLQDVYSNHLSKENVKKRITEFSNYDGKISLEDAVSYTLEESRLFTEEVVQSLLIRLAYEGFLVDPNEKDR